MNTKSEKPLKLSFKELGLESSLTDALDAMGYQEPSPIQEQAIPYVLKGKDLIALAETGSGKTAACAIPVCQLVDPSRVETQALIVVPTRELALQYATETQKIGKKRGVKAFAIFGGEDAGIQEAKLGHQVNVLVATPGRLIDFIYSRRIDLSHVKILVLDEADEMLSMGFYEDLNFIIQCLIQDHQTLLFSATMPKEIRSIAKMHMKEPVEILLTRQNRIPETIEHRFLFCRPDQRDDRLIQLMQEMRPKQTIIFGHTRIQVEKLCKTLQKEFHDVDFLHGALSQEMRTMITRRFRTGKIRYLVATDVAARGLDFSEVSHVFIYQMSQDLDIFLHRSGRTGRFQKSGIVVALVTGKDFSVLAQIETLLKKKLFWIGKPPPFSKRKV